MKTIIPSLLILLISCSHGLRAQLITNFGPEASVDFGWSWNPGTSTLSGTEGAGDVLYGETLSANFVGASMITITANVTSAPNAGFSFALVDDTEKLLVATFDWLDFAGGATVSSPISYADAGFNYAGVTGWNLISGGSNSPISATLISAAVIPEPSTYAAFAGGTMLGLALIRRRRARPV